MDDMESRQRRIRMTFSFALVLLALSSAHASPAFSASDSSSHAISPGVGKASFAVGMEGARTASETSPAPTKALRGAKQIATGDLFACALMNGGTVDCWGQNYSGELGNGSVSADVPNPTPVVALTGVKQISAGSAVACAVLSTGAVDCWGQLTASLNPNEGWVDTPTPVAGVSGVIQVGVGTAYICVLLADRNVDCWGENRFDQLGSGEPTTSPKPVRVPGLHGVTQLAINEFNACALISGGTIKCWGQNFNGQLGDGKSGQSFSGVVTVRGITGATQVATGNGTTCATMKDGTVKCWGRTTAGQEGITSSKGYSSVPVTVPGLVSVRQVAVGQTEECAVHRTGWVECWGTSVLQGNGASAVFQFLPMDSRVTGLSNASSVSLGISSGTSQHACALVRGGTVKCWGDNFAGELGDGASGEIGPTLVTGLGDVSQVSAGVAHTCALLETGSIECWGLDMFGELGNGVGPDRARPVVVPGVTGATQISSGRYDTCALLKSGTVKCWGYNVDGEVGDGHTSGTFASNRPTLVKGLSDVQQISVGWDHSCALLHSGVVKCWGANSQGQLGNGSAKTSTTPVSVKSLSGVTQIETSVDDSCALLSDGTVKCWGSGQSGQLGNGEFSVRSLIPVTVSNLTGASQIGMGNSYACALLSGTVECWGDNSYDELGNAGDNSAVPVSVGQLSSVSGIALGGTTSCAFTATTTFLCWGGGDDTAPGVIADWTPTTINTVAGAINVSIGGGHECALFPAGSIECWGQDYDGQDGNGTLGYSAVPVWVVT
jgi:alpha-tubulin suppressor-like RCC1 family protein